MKIYALVNIREEANFSLNHYFRWPLPQAAKVKLTPSKESVSTVLNPLICTQNNHTKKIHNLLSQSVQSAHEVLVHNSLLSQLCGTNLC